MMPGSPGVLITCTCDAASAIDERITCELVQKAWAGRLELLHKHTLQVDHGADVCPVLPGLPAGVVNSCSGARNTRQSVLQQLKGERSCTQELC
jgi:hypothetical protein